jgi:hypothetical protein
MNEIYLLTDYKGHFGSKNAAVPYRSGFDKDKIASCFRGAGFQPVFLGFCDVDFRQDRLKGQPVLYTSSEDRGLLYRSFIEDIVLGLELQGARVIPSFRYLRAHHNKVFMEILREQSESKALQSLRSRTFGTPEEMGQRIESVALPCVVKPAAGSMSAGLELCRDERELRQAASRVSSSRHLPTDARDLLRKIRRPGYLRESSHRRKFVAQSFVPGLENDWKVLVYGKKYYVLRRKVRGADFRASGSGRFEFLREVPAGLLDFAHRITEALEVPHLSLDIAFDGRGYLLFEFQALYFGSLTLEKSECHFKRGEAGWDRIDAPSEVEEEYVRAVTELLGRGRPGF